MGYFGAGFVFSQQPDWHRLDALPKSHSMRGYRHRSQHLWLLDVWPSKLENSYPFTSGRESKWIDRPQSSALDALNSVVGVLPEKPEGSMYAAWTVAVSRTIGVPTFFFAADDEALDLAIHADGQDMTRLVISTEELEVRFADSQWTITPFDLKDEELPPISLPTAPPFVKIMQPRVVHDRIIYGNPVAEWPPDAGDPQKVLGLGTWDPFQNVAEDFTLEYERIGDPQAKTNPSQTAGAPQHSSTRVLPKKKPWWKFW